MNQQHAVKAINPPETTHLGMLGNTMIAEEQLVIVYCLSFSRHYSRSLAIRRVMLEMLLHKVASSAPHGGGTVHSPSSREKHKTGIPQRREPLICVAIFYIQYYIQIVTK